MKREHKEEASTAAIVRAWNAAPDGTDMSAQGRIVAALTVALEAEGLTKGGKLTETARALLRRVDARARTAAKLKAGAS